MAKKTYYDITNILMTKAQYMILLGQRSNGKSYQAKLTVLKNAYENERKFVYLRRWKEDIKTKAIDKYFGDMNIQKITNGEYDTIVAWNGGIYFARKNEKGQTIKSKEKAPKPLYINDFKAFFFGCGGRT